MLTVYGIRQCDKVRAALRWLEANGAAFVFIDLRETPPSPAQVNDWLARAGAKSLVNSRSTTWRELDEGQRALIDTDPTRLLCHAPTLVRRPLVDAGARLVPGCDLKTLAELATPR